MFKNERRREHVDSRRGVEVTGMDRVLNGLNLSPIKDLTWTLGLVLRNHSRVQRFPKDNFLLYLILFNNKVFSMLCMSVYLLKVF